MQEWQLKALELLPEMQDEILESDNPMRLWVEIVIRFDEAYEKPRNDSFIKRIYDYEEWCLGQNSGETLAGRDLAETAGNDLPTCVVVAFWEHIPTNKVAREDMPRWFSLEEVLANEHIFKYVLSDEDFRELVDHYSKSTLKLER